MVSLSALFKMHAHVSPGSCLPLEVTTKQTTDEGVCDGHLHAPLLRQDFRQSVSSHGEGGLLCLIVDLVLARTVASHTLLSISLLQTEDGGQHLCSQSVL